MDLTPDEQHLIAEFRKLTPAGKDELLALAASLASRAEADGTSNQCRLKGTEARPEAKKTPIFTE
jgi:hypothetical protein